MKRLLLAFMVVGLMLGLLASFTAAAPFGVTGKEAMKELAAARRATAKYHDVNAAVADGYAPFGDCVEVPGLGGMGVHYVRFDLFDTDVSILEPEVLLYVETGGGMRLVGVEYAAVALANTAAGPAPWDGDSPPPLGWFTDPPAIFGTTLNGWMEGHESPMPWHGELHVWLRQGNADGIFADFNPNVSCP